MNLEWIKYSAVGLFVLFLDKIIFSHLNLWGISFDPLLIYIIWMLPKQDRIPSIYTVAFLAFVQDVFFDSWGLYLFSKSLIVLFFHRYLRDKFETKIFGGQFFYHSLVITLTHNVIFYVFASLTGDYATGWWPFLLLLISSLYTSLISFLTYLIYYK